MRYGFTCVMLDEGIDHKNPIDFSHGRAVWGANPEDAACAFVRREELRDKEFSIAEEAKEVLVACRHPWKETVHFVTVKGRMTPDYYSTLEYEYFMQNQEKTNG